MNEVQVKILSPRSDVPFVANWFKLAQDSHFWMQGRLFALLKQFRRNHIPVDRPWRGLEIGCGHGVLRSQIERNTSWTVDGVDLDLASLKENPICRGDAYLYDIFDRQHFFKEYFDFLILYDVIEHVEHVKPFWEACLFHLKPGGYVFINVPALKALNSHYDKVVGHWRRYDRDMLAGEIEQASLEIVHINYWGLFFLPLLFLRKVFLAKDPKDSVVVEKGFNFHESILNNLFKAIIWAEVALLPDPFLGTSVMAIARKKL